MKSNSAAVAGTAGPGCHITGGRYVKYLPYAGMPIVLAAFLILRVGKADIYTLSCNGLMLVFGYIAAITDLRTRRIPNRFLVVMLVAWAVVVFPGVFSDTESAVGTLKEAAFGFAMGGGRFLFMYIISRRGLGGGDVEYMECSGLYLGFTGVITVMLFGTVAAALTGLVLIILKKIGRKDAIPLAPFLYIGVLVNCIA
jgi:Flp pilus assembly protein protease CpaA